MADKHNERFLAREGELSQESEKDRYVPVLKPLFRLAFHER